MSNLSPLTDNILYLKTGLTGNEKQEERDMKFSPLTSHFQKGMTS